MQPRQFVVVGVGVLIASADAAFGVAQSAPPPVLSENPVRLQLDGKASQSNPDSPTGEGVAQPTPVEPPQLRVQNSIVSEPAARSVPFTVQNPEPPKPGRTSVIPPTVNPPKTGKLMSPTVAPTAQNPATTQLPPVTAPFPSPLSTPDSAPSFTPLPDLAPTPTPKPAKVGPAPDYLNPDPNPLQFPTKPEEVRLRGIQPITLQQAIDLAIRNNRNLQVAKLQLQRRRADLREAQAELFPTLSVQGNVTRSQDDTQNNNTLSKGFTTDATLNYNVFTSGGRPARIRSVEQQVRSDELQVEITREQLVLDVANDYYDLQEADENVRIRLASVRNAEASLRDTRALERAGLGTRFDVLRAEVQLANEVQSLTNARAAQFQRRRQLAQRLSLPAWVDLAAADLVQEAGAWALPLDETIILALKNRAELVQQLAQRELGEQQRRAALAGLGPTVNVSARYQLAENFRDVLGPIEGYTVAAGIRWDLFDGGAAIARARQAEANKETAETQFADANNQIRQQVETAYSNLRANFESISTTRRAVEQAREALRLARLRFQAGVGTQTEVINAENDLTRAEGNAVTAVLGYNRALAALRRAVSNLPIGSAAATPGTP